MLKLYNTLTKKVEEFVPRDPNLVTLYCCGPTVYDYAHIGNFRTYAMTDFLVRTLRHFGYKVKFVMNITDVGHLTSDSDTGEDKMEKGAKREGKTAWDIAKFYTDAFLADSKKLNLVEPDVRPKPTEHIAEQIAMIEALLQKGFAYQIDDGIYFDTSKFAGYGALTGQNIEELKAGARVEPNPQKRNPTDFALWKFSPKDKKRDMEWDSPFAPPGGRGKGLGFPGWHIECSAMSRKHLGDQIDIHTGGADLIAIHHTNEIAQSEATSGKSPFVRFWVHGQFILVDGKKMSKSLENFYRLADIEAKGFDSLALRYLYMTAHYRAFLNFTWEALANAQKTLEELRSQLSAISYQLSAMKRTQLSQEKLEKVDAYRKRFDEALENDLNMPQALAVVWEVVKSNIPSQDKYDLLLDFDEVFGLNLRQCVSASVRQKEIPQEVQELAKKREALRKTQKFAEADAVRKEIEKKGFTIEDTPEGPTIKFQ
ncbi:MAG: cysteine--tRNA ligase [Patescibacteria group bacterium]